MDTKNRDVTEDRRRGPERGSAGADGAGGSDDRQRPREIGGRGGPDPTRYGDWEKAGRCIDF